MHITSPFYEFKRRIGGNYIYH